MIAPIQMIEACLTGERKRCLVSWDCLNKLLLIHQYLCPMLRLSVCKMSIENFLSIQSNLFLLGNVLAIIHCPKRLSVLVVL